MDAVTITGATPATQYSNSLYTQGNITGTFIDTADTIVVRFSNDQYGNFDVTGQFAPNSTNTTLITYNTIPLYVTHYKLLF